MVPPVTPPRQRQRGSMGPPQTPFTTPSSSNRSRGLTPMTPSSSSSSSHLVRVKSEIPDPPSPSPRQSREPSTLPQSSPSPTRHALVVYQPRRRAPSLSPSTARARSYRPRSTTSYSSLAPSDSGSGYASRHGTEDFDRRARARRTREAGQESSSSAGTSLPPAPPLPGSISEPATIITDVLDGLYVQDIEADEGESAKDKVSFKQDVIKLLLDQLFDGRLISEAVAKELNEEEIVCPASDVARCLNILKKGISHMLTAALSDYTDNGSKSKLKSKAMRQSSWYGQYRARLPGMAGLIADDLTLADACAVVYLTAGQWAANTATLHGEMSKRSANAKRAQTHVVMNAVRKLCEILVTDIWNEVKTS